MENEFIEMERAELYKSIESNAKEKMLKGNEKPNLSEIDEEERESDSEKGEK